MLTVPAHAAELIGAWEWDVDDPDHGGYSAIEMSEDGQTAIVLNDRGRLLDVRIDRRETAITAITIDRTQTVPKPPIKDARADTEGLAQGDDGVIHISFESPSLVASYSRTDAALALLPIRDSFPKVGDNRGLEALAVAPDGALWTIVEERIAGSFPVSIYRAGRWLDGPRLPSDGIAFVPTGADFDDQGRLYLLERQFLGPFGFRSRVRRFDLADDTVAGVETLIETEAGQHDNLEGIALWRDDEGRLIATMVSDDNFFPLQRTELVEYVLPD